MKARNVVVFACATLASMFAIAPGARAQAYPTRPIRLIVPFAPGGGNDTLARLFGQKLTESLGQAVVIENRPGAGTTIATAQVARAAPDGYTLLLSSIASHAVSPNLYRNPGYDPIKDFAPVALLGIAPVILAVNVDVPAHSVGELIKLAKARPGDLKFASGGVGSVMHTSGMVFSQVAGVQMLHVPYKGAGPGYVALMAHEVDLVIDTAAALMPYVSTGKVRGLAIARKTRMPEAPDLPTFAEAGLPEFEANGWYSIHAPAGTPAPVIDKLNREINRISNMPDVKERLRQLGTEVAPDNTPENLTAFVRSELAKYTQVIKNSGIQPE
ncbi:tripartite tricarboxylate transporter substrate binding protein [Pigmentiphaga soli]|uniref:Tripartite tricarboxylate transporter substrate binding protein n=1 Tax=Pigmentiphaga soli TaxID=1007095 RepID=A0ABP8GSA5_9BURK